MADVPDLQEQQVWSAPADFDVVSYLADAYALQIRPGSLVHIWMEADLKPGVVTALNNPGSNRFTVDATLLEGKYCVRSVDMNRLVGNHLREEEVLRILHEAGFNREQALATIRGLTDSNAAWEQLLPKLWSAKDREEFVSTLNRCVSIRFCF